MAAFPNQGQEVIPEDSTAVANIFFQKWRRNSTIITLFYCSLTNLVEHGRKAQHRYESSCLKIREVDLQDPRFVGGLFLCPNRIPIMTYRRSWSPTGLARGTSMRIPSYAKASEGYPPVAKSAEATSFSTSTVEAQVTHSSTGRARGLLRRRIKFFGSLGIGIWDLFDICSLWIGI